MVLKFDFYYFLGWKEKKQAQIIQQLASEFNEWANIYPGLSLLAAVALVFPVFSINCKREFSAMNRVSDIQPGESAQCVNLLLCHLSKWLCTFVFIPVVTLFHIIHAFIARATTIQLQLTHKCKYF